MAHFLGRRVRIVGLLLVLAVMMGSMMRTARPQAQQKGGGPRIRQGLAVVDAGTANGIADMGSTFYYLEGKAVRVTTRFKDGSVEATRSADGAVRARLRDAGGNPLSDVAVEHASGVTAGRLEFSAATERLVTDVRPSVRPTLDWAGSQAYALWKDRPGPAEDVEWQGRFIRSRGLKSGSLDDLALDTEAEYENGVKVRTARNSQDVQIGPRVRRRPTFISKVTANGAEVGVIRWYANEKVLAWDYPGLSKGFVNADRLKQVGGWTFTPTMAWANTQGMAFYEFHSRVKARGSIAQSGGGLLRRTIEAFVPTVHANDAGCDMLHWLDGSIVRPCCDTHDRCYQRSSASCSVSSWWTPMWGAGWQCSVCNIQAQVCFLTGGLFDIDYQSWW